MVSQLRADWAAATGGAGAKASGVLQGVEPSNWLDTDGRDDEGKGFGAVLPRCSRRDAMPNWARVAAQTAERPARIPARGDSFHWVTNPAQRPLVGRHLRGRAIGTGGAYIRRFFPSVLMNQYGRPGMGSHSTISTTPWLRMGGPRLMSVEQARLPP